MSTTPYRQRHDHLPRPRGRTNGDNPGREITGTDEVALSIFGYLARDEYQPATSRDDDMGECQGNGYVLGIDARERHGLADLLWRMDGDGPYRRRTRCGTSSVGADGHSQEPSEVSGLSY